MEKVKAWEQDKAPFCIWQMNTNPNPRAESCDADEY